MCTQMKNKNILNCFTFRVSGKLVIAFAKNTEQNIGLRKIHFFAKIFRIFRTESTD
jgi:hypothetical protein